jgi:TatD DNase family protein
MKSGQSSIGESQAPLTDTHAHLDFSQFDEDRDQVIDRATNEGITYIVTVGFDLDSSRQAVALANSHANLWACVGIHPHEASQVNPEVLNNLRELSRHHKVVAVGEIGLDYYRDRSPRDVQRWAFRQELDLAAEAGKPVVIHDRAAHQDVMHVIRAWAEAISSSNAKLQPPLGVVHCFSGDLTMARELFQLGFYVSIAGPVTFPNASRLHELVSRLPLERLLIETDCPFLSPHPYRAKRNEPANVKLIAQRIAQIKDMPLEKVSQVTTANACRVFRLQ